MNESADFKKPRSTNAPGACPGPAWLRRYLAKSNGRRAPGKGCKVIGRGWHQRAGQPHAEIEALRDAQKRGHTPKGATLYVTLEPCCTHGRTPPCTDAIIAAGIRRTVAGATDPNPQHCGRGFKILESAGLAVSQGVLAEECNQLNEAFNHWMVRGTPFVTVKAAMTLDGKVATASGESKWITGEQARAYGMKLRQGADAILVGINTILADDPRLTVRTVQSPKSKNRTTQDTDPSGSVQSPKSGKRRHTLEFEAYSSAHRRLGRLSAAEHPPRRPNVDVDCLRPGPKTAPDGLGVDARFHPSVQRKEDAD